MLTSNPTHAKLNGLPSTINAACLGWYSKGNCGDESYKLTLPELFPNLKLSFCDTLPPVYDCVLLGGGDVLTLNFMDKLSGVKKPIHAISVTSSEPIGRSDISFKNILARDLASLRNLEREGLTAEYCPDAAFALNADAKRGKELIKKYFNGRDLYQKVVAVVINSHLLADPERSISCMERLSFMKFAYDICKIIDSTAASFIFIPFGLEPPWDDRSANSFIASHCKFWQKTMVVYDQISVQDTLDLISGCDAMLSTRLHSSIFSCVAEVPFIDIVHNHKNEWFLETINHNDYALDLRNFNSSKAFELLNDILFNPTSHLLQIKMINREQKQILERQVKRCMCAMMTLES